jgi:ribosome-binding protein aMBF1 (putative translation factor)
MDFVCDFCGKKVLGKIVLRDPSIVKKDGSDVLLCVSCLNNYSNGDFERIKLRKVVKNMGDKFRVVK